MRQVNMLVYCALLAVVFLDTSLGRRRGSTKECRKSRGGKNFFFGEKVCKGRCLSTCTKDVQQEKVPQICYKCPEGQVKPRTKEEKEAHKEDDDAKLDTKYIPFVVAILVAVAFCGVTGLCCYYVKPCRTQMCDLCCGCGLCRPCCTMIFDDYAEREQNEGEDNAEDAGENSIADGMGPGRGPKKSKKKKKKKSKKKKSKKTKGKKENKDDDDEKSSAQASVVDGTTEQPSEAGALTSIAIVSSAAPSSVAVSSVAPSSVAVTAQSSLLE